MPLPRNCLTVRLLNPPLSWSDCRCDYCKPWVTAAGSPANPHGQDALGLDLVGVQAKRYDRESAVQRPEMQAFVAALLQGAQTSRGVFVTTGRFSTGARQFADQVAMRLVLIDGTELTRLMVRYDVGVAVKETYQLKAVDDDFFEDSE